MLMSEGLYGFTAGQFLFLYVVLLGTAGVLSGLIASLLRLEGVDRTVEDADDLALLANGRQRFGEATITRLLTERVIANNPNGTFHLLRRDLARSGVDFAVANATPGNWKALMKAAKPYADQTERRLIANGLMMEEALFARSRLLLTLPFIALALFGGLRLMIGVARDRPVGFLAALLIVTLGIAVARYLMADQRTKAGIRVLNQIKRANQRLLQAPTHDELPHAVALFGTVALLGSSYSNVHKLRDLGNGGGGCGSGDSGGDGGGGGGGCGGCGGD
jgi:uncharacterized protein (TIGR04222 family)